MAINTQIPQAEWKDFFVTFTDGNRGRQIALEVLDADQGAQGQVNQGKLMAVDYDSPGKGNHIVISTGVDELDYSHTVDDPVELWRAQADDGEITALELVSGSGVKTIIRLE